MIEYRRCDFPHRENTEALFAVELSDGCVCYPHSNLLYLCSQHWHGLEPLGSAEAWNISTYEESK